MLTREHHRIASVAKGPRDSGDLDSLWFHDLVAGTEKVWTPGAAIGEPIYIPGAERDYWGAIGTDPPTDMTSRFYLLTVDAPEEGPIATVDLPIRVPAGLHGAWLADPSPPRRLSRHRATRGVASKPERHTTPRRLSRHRATRGVASKPGRHTHRPTQPPRHEISTRWLAPLATGSTSRNPPTPVEPTPSNVSKGQTMARRTIVWSRPGPTPMHDTCAPDSSSSRRM